MLPPSVLGGLSCIVSQPSQDSGAGATPTKLSNLMHQKQLSQRKKGKKLVRNYIPIQTSICFPLYKKSILCLYSYLAVAHACQPYLQVGICDVSYLDASWRGDLLETKTSLILKNVAQQHTVNKKHCHHQIPQIIQLLSNLLASLATKQPPQVPTYRIDKRLQNPQRITRYIVGGHRNDFKIQSQDGNQWGKGWGIG